GGGGGGWGGGGGGRGGGGGGRGGRLPQPATGLAAYVDNDAIVVGWDMKRARVDGSSLKDLARFKLYRHEDAEGAPLKPALLSSGRITGYDEIASIALDAPAPAVVRGDHVEWVDRQGLVRDRRYLYVVTATDATGRTSPPSARLAVPFLAPPDAPRGVRETAGDRPATLSSVAPTDVTDRSPTV